MSQRDFLRQFDRIAFSHFQRTGLAFQGAYRGPEVAFTAPAQAVSGCIDHGVEFFGEFGQVVGRRDEMTLLLQDVAPAKGGHVDADGQRFVLAEKLDADESAARYVVREVAIVPDPDP